MTNETRMAENEKDPSMEDILASIRKIVDDGGEAPRPGGEEAPAPGEDEPLELTEIVHRADAPGPRAVPAGIMSEAAQRRASAALTPLAEGARQRAAPRGPSLEEVVVEQLKPMLARWLDEHLPAIVERVVERELRALARRIEDDEGR